MITRITSLILLVAVVACSRAEPITHLVTGVFVAGPICPVETDPPDPSCAPRPVAGAQVIATADGRNFTATSDQNGMWSLQLPDGVYLVTPQVASGLMGTAEQFTITVDGGDIDLGEIAYDTGIR